MKVEEFNQFVADMLSAEERENLHTKVLEENDIKALEIKKNKEFIFDALDEVVSGRTDKNEEADKNELEKIKNNKRKVRKTERVYSVVDICLIIMWLDDESLTDGDLIKSFFEKYLRKGCKDYQAVVKEIQIFNKWIDMLNSKHPDWEIENFEELLEDPIAQIKKFEHFGDGPRLKEEKEMNDKKQSENKTVENDFMDETNKNHRDAKGISERELARLMYVSERTIRKWRSQLLQQVAAGTGSGASRKVAQYRMEDTEHPIKFDMSMFEVVYLMRSLYLAYVYQRKVEHFALPEPLGQDGVVRVASKFWKQLSTYGKERCKTVCEPYNNNTFYGEFSKFIQKVEGYDSNQEKIDIRTRFQGAAKTQDVYCIEFKDGQIETGNFGIRYYKNGMYALIPKDKIQLGKEMPFEIQYLEREDFPKVTLENIKIFDKI